MSHPQCMACMAEPAWLSRLEPWHREHQLPALTVVCWPRAREETTPGLCSFATGWSTSTNALEKGQIDTLPTPRRKKLHAANWYPTYPRVHLWTHFGPAHCLRNSSSAGRQLRVVPAAARRSRCTGSFTERLTATTPLRRSPILAASAPQTA